MHHSSPLLIALAAALSPLAHGAPAVAIRGDAVIHLRPDSDVLAVRIEKRDLNIYDGEDVLRATLLSPDRRVVAEIGIPDDGNAKKGGGVGKPQAETIQTRPAEPGVYRLCVLPAGDLVFNFAPNCKRYMVEGDIFLNDYRLATDVFFMPPTGKFTIRANAVHKPGVQKLPLYDAAGKLVHTFDLPAVRKPATFTVPAAQGDRTGLWRIKVGKQDVQISIQNVRYWTPVAESYFPVHKTQMMLTPYSRQVYLQPGESTRVEFTLRNRAAKPQQMDLQIQSPPWMQCRVASPKLPALVKPKAPAPVVIELAAAANAPRGAEETCKLTASYTDDPSARAAASIRAKVGPKPRMDKLALPIVLRPYAHEDVQFGYAPEYPCNPPFFDLHNRPYIRQRAEDRDKSTGIFTLVAGRWIERPFEPSLRAKYPNFASTRRAAGWYGTKTVFDSDNHLYTLLQVRLRDRSARQTLLYSRDAGRTFQVYELPKGVADIEQFVGHNTLPHPPPVLLYTPTKPHPARFCTFHDLKLFLPRKTADGLDLGEPVLISDKCFGSCQHSGNPAATATRDGRTHVVWGEVDDSGVPGAPTYIRTYDHAKKKLGPKVFLGYAPPVNDVHNVPGICMDSEGYLHVITGAHGRPFTYRRSLKPNDAYSGWTKAEPVLQTGSKNSKTGQQEGRQTYLAFVCDSKDTLHIAFRQWRAGVDPYHSGQNYAALSYQRKPKGKPWEDARPLVVAAFPGYSIYYHKLTIDRRDRLYLSYSYWTPNETYVRDFPGRYLHRAVLSSADGGDTWKLAETRDFEAGLGR